MSSPSRRLSPAARRWLVLLAKLIVVGLVVVFVGGAAREAWGELTEQGVRVHLLYAFASGVALLVGMAPLAWFWRQTLAALGQPADWGHAFWAFYISQLGKYVPGKASVVLIRTERMMKPGASGRLIAACVFYETLTHMAVGGVLSVVLIGLGVGGLPQGQTVWLMIGSLMVAMACFAPTLPPVARWFLSKIGSPIKKGTNDDEQGAAEALHRGLTVGLMVEGWCASLVAWSGLAVSVWLGALSVGAWSSSAPQLWLLAAALPVAAGFLSLLPAGVLVRDGLMLGLLSPTLGEAGALATTLAVRLIWVVSEVLLCGILGVAWRPARKPGAESPSD